MIWHCEPIAGPNTIRWVNRAQHTLVSEKWPMVQQHASATRKNKATMVALATNTMTTKAAMVALVTNTMTTKATMATRASIDTKATMAFDSTMATIATMVMEAGAGLQRQNWAKKHGHDQ